ncbi:hypothetical protein BDV97DRAFT_303451 [Delphinella strobiligena]|nr:hypothetical protein BDV97DRAFT_303451 [Delphinella strobiligena]
MPGNDDYTDDYVAELLKRDAKATSSAASNLGIGSLLTKRPTGSAPKPNTRFLNNLIRDTTSHNAALLAKEADESEARLRRLREKEGRLRGKPEQQLYSARARHDGSAARPTKRRRLSEDMDEKSRKRERPGDEEKGYAHGTGHHANARRRRDDDDSDDKDHAHSRSKKHRKRSRSPDGGEERLRKSSHRHESHRHRSRSTSRHRSDKRTHRSKYSSSPEPPRRERNADSQSSTIRRQKSPESDSDPLEAIVGPAPPCQPTIRSKGRGAFNPTTIDSHFAANYDPSADTIAEVEEQDDWEGALEALRDRQKWRQQGAERLLAAGFSEQEVEKWRNEKINSKGEREMDEADVKWSKVGEGREWDRGKVVDDESGHVELKPEWGRLKGT